jgi:TetR/AcrR family transcriptional regulator, transcriptional repressor for nem operon
MYQRDTRFSSGVSSAFFNSAATSARRWGHLLCTTPSEPLQGGLCPPTRASDPGDGGQSPPYKNVSSTPAQSIRASGTGPILAGRGAHKFAELMAWLVEYHAKAWDQQIETDLDAGRSNAVLASAGSDRAGTAAATYLSTEHRDNPSEGCPLAVIGSELSRSDEKTRKLATVGFLNLVDIIAAQSGAAKTAEARRKALVAVSTMIDALTVSRIVTDPELSAELLREAKKSLSKA